MITAQLSSEGTASENMINKNKKNIQLVKKENREVRMQWGQMNYFRRTSSITCR